MRSLWSSSGNDNWEYEEAEEEDEVRPSRLCYEKEVELVEELEKGMTQGGVLSEGRKSSGVIAINKKKEKVVRGESSCLRIHVLGSFVSWWVKAHQSETRFCLPLEKLLHQCFYGLQFSLQLCIFHWWSR